MVKIKKNKVNRAWVNRHVTDHYVHEAGKQGYRSRAAYKLLEIDNDFNIFEHVKNVVDLGAAPGSWSQVLCQKLGSENLILGVDLLEMDPITGVTFIQGDFTDDATFKMLAEVIGTKKIDLVVSDMAPNISGIKDVDQARFAYLVELILDFVDRFLKVGGDCVIKFFYGGEVPNLLKMARQGFKKVSVYKPKASRPESKEVYLICKGKL